MADIASLIFEIIKCIATPTCRCVDYHRNFKRDMEDLRSKLRILNFRKEDVERQLQAEVSSLKEGKKEVEGWLQEVQRINAEIQDVEERVVRIASHFSRARIGKLVREKINVVDAVFQRGIFPGGLVVDKSPTTLPLPVENLEGEVIVKEKIWEYLTGNDVQMIGVCGIGGVGKTTIMKHTYNELLKGSSFDRVIWVTVSYPLNVVRLQNEIAKGMNESLLGDDQDEQSLASRLMHIMGKVKYVLILDDVWETFTLEHVGIPPPTLENGCKLVITSRKVDVCHFLGCQVIKVEPLSKQESLNLFLDKVGKDILQVPELEGILKLMVEECAGLPLAIVVIAGSMKGVTDVHVWRHALKELRERVRGTAQGSEDEIFERLKFSYDRLQDSNIQNCFLSCSLYAEDYTIRRDELVEQWINEGLIEESGSIQAILDKGWSILNKLQNNCLLETAELEGEVKMHDIVRGMALRIKGAGPRFMVKARMSLEEIPDEHEWTKNLEKVSLMDNQILDIPLNMSPNCPNLTTLMFQQNWRLTQIPDCFFTNMHRLKFLNLSHTSIESLPNSICNLESLTTLLLRDCKNLKHMPCLAKLKALKKLDLLQAGIEVVPEGIEMLVNLQYLDLWCRNLVELPTGMLSNLCHLQHLVVYYKSTTLRIKGEEVRRLKKLETLQAQLYDQQDFNNYVKSNHFKRLSNYVLVVGQVKVGPTFSKMISLRECEIGGKDSVVLPDDMQELLIYQCRKFQSLSDISSLQKTTKWKCCYITECEDIKCVVDRVTSSFSFISNLKELWLRNLPNLRVLVNVEGVKATPPHIFSNLKSFWVEGCSRMKRLLPFELLPGLQNLDEITVGDCEQMEEIIGREGKEENHTDDATTTSFTLPKLRQLLLKNLPKLEIICPTRKVMVCNSLQELWIESCPKLRRIPMIGNVQPSSPPPPVLQYINIWPKELWESLEWDDPNAKNVLQPLVIFIGGQAAQNFASTR